MDRRRVGQGQLVQLAKSVHHLASIEDHRHFSLLDIDAGDDAQVAIEDIPVIIIDHLHHLVARAIA